MLLVFGSINLDLSIAVPALPRPGETVLGGALLQSPGGKGANQAHAAQRFGVPTQLIGAVGDDGFAAPALERLQLAGVDLSAVRWLPGCTTGLASINVAAGGENSIVVAPGANALMRADWVDDEMLGACHSLLMQLELPAAECLALARRARRLGCRTVLNAAPWTGTPLPHGLFDWLIVNAGELRAACLQQGLGDGDPAVQARGLAAALGARVLLTLGRAGALIADADGVRHRRAAPALDVIDTTGAGDTCAGVFAAALSQGADDAAALEWAVVAASLACTARGAQAAQPLRREIDATRAALRSSTH
ncbi:ribokinase [Aquincola sp. S2]|uniref:Ribokinase n=1 Tax=Pseudaquabacterium terrae TaxID=2732868 RepID=A0ABX2EMJ8_9BURK|nr:ribokinase [Aquabacterium terrae]NRF69776.1 ribokinase [Aquabacterium terrae]